MRTPRLYLPVPLMAGAMAPLDGDAFSHAVRVLRLEPGAPLVLFDGSGGAFAAILAEIGKRDALARVTEALPGEVESPLPVVLVQGVSRGEKMDYTLRKAVELGVVAIQPVFAERGGVHLAGERLERKTQHWRRIVIGACEQCGRNRLPELGEPLPLADWLSRLASADLSGASRHSSLPLSRDVPEGWENPQGQGLRLLLDPLADRGLRGLQPPSGPVTVLIGPEGGLSPAEIARARAAGFTSVRLGPRILRTETAGVAVLAAVQALWGDWE
ncbi:MAG: 16S rRNA (uracil(1498)-N(3))-methyltransferase [Candidatus Competibacter sp.]|nr:16S rRNA (uracil(1498)-N(3))-methyltransferase [Candidatus Competibacter sp.]